MTKVEGMIKSENQRNDFDKAFWRSGTELVIREEPNDSRVYDLEEQQLDSARWLSNLRKQFRKIQ